MKTTHLKIEITAGTGQDALGRLITGDQRDSALREIRKFGADLFGGITVVESSGSWKSPAGQLVEERGVVITALVSVDKYCRKSIHKAARLMASTVKGVLSQQSVVVATSEVYLQFQ